MEDFIQGFITLLIFFFFFILPAVINIIKKQTAQGEKNLPKKGILQKLFANLENIDQYIQPEIDETDPQVQVVPKKDPGPKLKKITTNENEFEHLYEIDHDKEAISELANSNQYQAVDMPNIKEMTNIKDMKNIVQLDNNWNENEQILTGLKKIESLSTFKKAIFYGELLGKPRAFKDY